ncbi:MAG TPA: CDGSH iron-sulfur domain-containing protein [Dehalococcoidales bacterium]|jgi:CDGSH-type Zn-finger protein|nr:CDGSH iron-sulfur domain-containing protein [Dehalococcoidales bacterium]
MTKVKNTAKYKIKITKNGPYLVSGGVPLSGQTMCLDSEGQCHGWKKTKKYPLLENYALCRCGRSGNMPFCDGSHGKANFDGKETASRLPYLIQAGEIDGPGVKLTDVQNLCASARFCHRGGGTWKLAHQSDNPEARKMMIEEVADCPSGRLAAWDKDGKPIEPDFEPSIGVVEDVQAGKMGPLWVRGGIPIEAEDGTTYETRNRVTLCRCGKSLNKPFCDSRHLK